MLTPYFRHYAENYSAYKEGPICYEDGCLYRGLIALFESTGEQRWFDLLVHFASQQIAPDGTMTGYVQEEYNIDNVLSGRAFLYLAANSDDPRYKIACDTLREQLKTHPCTKGGNYWHKKRYPHQVWLDGLYMGLPFQIEYGLMYDDEDLVNDALRQMEGVLEIMGADQNGLYAHGYDESRQQRWADDKTGLSQAHWARSVGWLAMALIDLCGLVGKENAGNLKDRCTALLRRIVVLQSPEGAWLQVIDQPDLDGNYLESSASAMFSYSLLKAARLGLGEQFAAPGLKAQKYLAQLIAECDPDKRVLPKIVCVAGLGGFDGNYRDGSGAYYISEIIKDDDIKGVGPFMMATAEVIMLEKK